MKDTILFICLGNICRSPLAEGIAKKMIKERGLALKIDSAGTSSYHSGEAPCENSIIIAKRHGVDISKQHSRQVTNADFNEQTIIIALDEANVSSLTSIGYQDALKLGSFGFNNEDVPDPYYFKGLEGFDKVYKMIESCVITLLDEL
jgi:protein-tyrosine phosphatase